MVSCRSGQHLALHTLLEGRTDVRKCTMSSGALRRQAETRNFFSFVVVGNVNITDELIVGREALLVTVFIFYFLLLLFIICR